MHATGRRDFAHGRATMTATGAKLSPVRGRTGNWQITGGGHPRRDMTPVLHPSVAERLARLAPDQRAAATAPPGPVLCVAPAGSGKTTTLVARVAWLVDGGADPGSVCIVAFNKRAAEELAARLDAAVAPLGVAAGSVRVRTFHALGREILSDAGVPVEPLADRDVVLRELFPASPGRTAAGWTSRSRGSSWTCA